MPDAQDFYFRIPDTGRPGTIKIPEERVPDYQWYDAHRSTVRSVHPIEGIEAVVIHATAGYSTRSALDTWRTKEASAHWVIPDENEQQHGNLVWAVVSESLAAWHVRNSATHPDVGNRTRINHWSVGIEIVNTQDVQDYTDPFSDWQVQIMALIIRYCWAKYPNLKHVISHARLDPTRRGDPGPLFPWDTFTDLIVSDANDPAPNPLGLSLP